MQGFGFGTGNLANLDNKVSLDRELELIDKDVYPNSEYMPPGQVNLITFFAQNKKFLMYHGHTTFEECVEAVYLISTDLAAFSKGELYDIDQHAYKSAFQTKSAAQLKIPVYKNYDPPKNQKKKPGLKQKAKPESPSKAKGQPKEQPNGKPVEDTNKPMDKMPKDNKQPPGEPVGQGNSKQATPPPPKTGSRIQPLPKQPTVIPPEAPKVGKLPLFKFDKEVKPFKFQDNGDPRDGPTLKDYAVHSGLQKPTGPVAEKPKKEKSPHKKPTIQEMYQRYLKIPKNPYERGSKEAEDFEKKMEEMKKQDDERKKNGSGTESETKTTSTSSSSSSSSKVEETSSSETQKTEKTETSNPDKYVIYRPPPGHKIGWIPQGAIMPGKEVDQLNIESHNQIYFPPLKNKRLKWGTIFYYKKDGEAGNYLPYIIKIPFDIKIPKNAPFFSIPVWDKYSKSFTKVTFRPPKNENAKNEKSKEPEKTKAKPVTPKKSTSPPQNNDPNNIQVKLNYGTEKTQKSKNSKNEKNEGDMYRGDGDNKNKRMFKSCDDGIEMMNNDPSEKLKQQLKDLCGIETGEKINKYLPGLGKLGNKLGRLGSLWH